MQRRAAWAITLITTMTVMLYIPCTTNGQTVEWPAYSADQSGTKYLPLDQINTDNVEDLEIVWRQPVIPDAIRMAYA